MGCTSSSASKPGNKQHPIKGLKFKDTGVHSVDDFLNKVKKCVKEFSDLLEPLDRAADRFADVTGFWRERKASKSHLQLLNKYCSFEALRPGHDPVNHLSCQRK